jgi:hypothetical protein
MPERPTHDHGTHDRTARHVMDEFDEATHGFSAADKRAALDCLYYRVRDKQRELEPSAAPKS